MRTNRKVKVKFGDREKIRRQLVNFFLEELPGSGKGELCSHYIYYVDELSDGKRVFLKRPAVLNKGFDFEVHIEDVNFGKSRSTSMPSHRNIVEDLHLKKKENSGEYKKLSEVIKILFDCNEPSLAQIKSLKFRQDNQSK